MKETMPQIIEVEKRIEEALSLSIALCERVHESVGEAQWFKLECSEVGKKSDRLCQMLRSAVRIASSYERPVRRIVAEASKNLDRALILVRKCNKSRSVLRRVVTIVSAADFRKSLSLLDASIGDMTWLLTILDSDSNDSGNGGRGIDLTLAPIASNDPILSWIWSFIASIHLGQLSERIEAANQLSSFAQDNNRNKKIIMEEGAIPPLLKLLKERESPEAQIAAATALYNLSSEKESVKSIVNELGVPTIVKTLANSPMRVQIVAADLVARMAEDTLAQEEFARENVIRPLVTFLSFQTFAEDESPPPKAGHSSKQSIHSIVQISKEMDRNSLMSFNYRPATSVWMPQDSSSRAGRREWDNETPELKLKLKVSCARALWMLAKGSVANSRRITETKGLLCLAKLIEKGKGELLINCLMTVMEITAAAESNADLRRGAFRTNSPAAKAVVDQLLRVMRAAHNNPAVQIPAIRSIGSLARTFPAREIRAVVPVVEMLSNRNHEVATAAAISLGKFACPDNFLSMEHTKTILEFNGVTPLMRQLRDGDKTEYHALVLLCYLVLHADDDNNCLEQARVLTALEGADRTVAAQHPELKELVTKAIYHLSLYHACLLPRRQSYAS